MSLATGKMLQRSVFILFLLLVLLHSMGGVLQVHIDSRDKGMYMCNITAQKMTCPSIEQFTREYANTSNVTIQVTGQVQVAALVVFSDITDLSIIGERLESKARLECNQTASTPPCRHGDCVGLQFVRVQTLNITNVEIIGCGGEYVFRNATIRSAVYINGCRDVTLYKVSIMSSHQTSLFIENTSGNVTLEEVCVRDNILTEYTTKPKESFAGGVQIFINAYTDESHYQIINSKFYNITTPNYTEYNPSIEGDPTDWIGYGLGGGLSITLDENSTHHQVLVNRCTFNGVKAPWGAGMHIRFFVLCSSNVVTVNNSVFQNSTASFAGGGMGIGITQQQPNENDDNHVFITNTKFSYNKAKYGGGTYVFAFHGDVPARNKLVRFTNCSWEDNRAYYGPAVDISPSSFDHLNTGSLPIPVFKDCNFTNNHISFMGSNHSEFVTVGVLVISRFIVTFEGTLHFDSNAYSALLLNSGQVIVKPNSRLVFTNNKGLRGGAISMHSFSSILVSDNCTLEFFNNTATEYGGAIYQYTTEIRESFAGRSCFLDYNGTTPVDTRNINFVFSGNAAPISGSSIFATSFHACYFTYRGSLDGHNLAEFLNDIGNFSLDPMNRTCKCIAPALGTTGSQVINKNDNNTLALIPGQQLSLPLTVKDELKQTLKTEFFTRIENNNEVSTNGASTVNNTITVYGYPHESADLIATTQHAYRSVQYTLAVELLPCPPGYYFDKTDPVSNLSCKCSAEEREQAFIGIPKCNSNNFTAVFQSGYWVGYYNNTLYTAVCPYDFCVRIGKEYSLPSSRTELNSSICRSGRKGVLCGQCSDGQSMHYHSSRLTCGDEGKCPYGIVFYILSELIPVFVFFTLVIIFDISFTSGATNGFVFFSQMVTILPQDFTRYGSGPLKYFQSGYNLFYRIFSIEFFSVEALSFCLFRGATVMDALAFKYITILFAFFLVIAVVLCIKYCTCCSKPCTIIKKKMTATASVIHGLSAFIVICYSECVRVSFFILRQTTLQGAGSKKGPSVAFYGGIDYLQGKHIPYAIPAIVSLGTIAVIPPFLLLVYPSILKVLELCKLSEHRLVTATLRVTRINTLMPMFDVFQGCFKDNFRFFSGLYFFYRMAILAPYAFSRTSLFQYTVITEFVLLVIIGAHSIVQPYKLKSHNVIDSLLFLDLAVLNGFTVLVLRLSQDGNALLPHILITDLCSHCGAGHLGCCEIGESSSQTLQ